MKHTPGPWEASIVSHNKKDWIAVGEANKSYPRFGKIIALCGECKGKHEGESIADAYLIAAAPDLLEACKESLYTMCRLCKIINPQHTGDPTTCDCQDASYLKKVIAKAEVEE